MRALKYFLFPSLVLILIFYFFAVCEWAFSQASTTITTTTTTQANATTAQENLIEENSDAQNPLKERQALEEELKKLEAQIGKYEKNIQKTEKEKRTLQNKIYILRNKIKKLNLQIYQSNLIVKDLSHQIVDTGQSIKKTFLKIQDSRTRLATILRTIYEEDQRSWIEILLSEGISDFFDNLVALEALNAKNQELLQHIKTLKSYLKQQKKALNGEKQDMQRQVLVQTLQRKGSARAKKKQEYFLKLTEAEYQKYLQQKQKTERRAQAIRSRIFELIGVPEAPTFGEALNLAKSVERITGVRPAFLLAVMTQESNIGKNVGQCFLTNSQTGEGTRVKTEEKVLKVMNPKRDAPHFLNICKELKRDPYNSLVSCPMSFGWGGAMGPAQFIPSTWIRYKDRVAEITAKPADPWKIKDAFLAAALYLADYGAAKQSLRAEWRAAMIYFSGTTNRRYRFYGDSVVKIAKQYEQDIRELEKAE